MYKNTDSLEIDMGLAWRDMRETYVVRPKAVMEDHGSVDVLSRRSSC